MKLLFAAATICAAIVGNTQAGGSDQSFSTAVTTEVLYQEIVTAATQMCNEAADQGDVTNVTRCVDVVVARTIAEANRATLTAYARSVRPAIIAVRP